MKALNLATAVALVLMGGKAVAGVERHSVLDLYSRVRQVPASAPDAAKWVDKQGRIVNKDVIALRADLETHRKSLEPIMAAGARTSVANGARVTQDLAKGMSDVGIDMARIQSDPAYAHQVQARVRSMSPAEILAGSQANQTRIVGCDAQVIGDIELMLSTLDEVVKSAAIRTNCGKQVILVPGAVCN